MGRSSWTGTNGVSLTERKELFQNAVYWLLRGIHCDNLNMRLELNGPTDPVTAGSEVAYAIRLSHSGACNATAVVVTHQLPAGLELLSVESGSAIWQRRDGALTFQVGRMSRGDVREIRIVARALQSGTLTNSATVRVNELEPLDDNTDSVVTVVGGGLRQPKFNLIRSNLGEWRIEWVDGEAGRAYNIETSTNLLEWTPVAALNSFPWTLPLLDPAARQKFYRARVR